MFIDILDATGPYYDTGCPPSAGGEATSISGAKVSFNNPTYLDAVDLDVTVTCSPESESVFSIGDTTVVCNGEDSSGNVSPPSDECSFTVTVTGNNFFQKKKKINSYKQYINK